MNLTIRKLKKIHVSKGFLLWTFDKQSTVLEETKIIQCFYVLCDVLLGITFTKLCELQRTRIPKLTGARLQPDDRQRAATRVGHWNLFTLLETLVLKTQLS